MLHANDIPGIIDLMLKMFADDTKLYGQNTIRKQCHTLKHNINAFSAWS